MSTDMTTPSLPHRHHSRNSQLQTSQNHLRQTLLKKHRMIHPDLERWAMITTSSTQVWKQNRQTNRSIRGRRSQWPSPALLNIPSLVQRTRPIPLKQITLKSQTPESLMNNESRPHLQKCYMRLRGIAKWWLNHNYTHQAHFFTKKWPKKWTQFMEQSRLSLTTATHPAIHSPIWEDQDESEDPLESTQAEAYLHINTRLRDVSNFLSCQVRQPLSSTSERDELAGRKARSHSIFHGNRSAYSHPPG